MAHSILQHHFENLEQQHETAALGMWVFLVTEVMFFGGLFTAYTVYRTLYPAAFADASHHLSMPMGAVNTAVLLCSSLTMALAVHFAQIGRRKATVISLLATMLLGAGFLAIKAAEWNLEYHEGLIPGGLFTYVSPDPANISAEQVQLFFVLYFAMTGLHALHMIIGLGLMSVLAFHAWRGRYSEDYFSPIENGGLYWHFVDIVWIFLFPLLYLIGKH
jgi:cytochrome c oxidase subunit III